MMSRRRIIAPVVWDQPGIVLSYTEDISRSVRFYADMKNLKTG